MNINELKNIQDEFELASDNLLESIEGNFIANVNSFRSLCNSNEILSSIIEKISSVSFDGIEYFNNKTNLRLRHSQFQEPTNNEEILKISYDLLWSNELKASHVYNYANWVLHPGTSRISELLTIGLEDLFLPLIKYINLELDKMIRKEFKPMPTSQINNFNIQNASNSIIGNQENATINNSYSMEELKSIVNEKVDDPSDKAQLNELINMLKVLTENNAPLNKGVLQNFGDLLVKHSWLTVPLGTSIVNWLTNI